ncbi:MAG: T9SS type A sorting domain-containing protein, partial [Bacteroidota bacterium]|nr:T9SS type A sorting domain-containing protein [Bacteroidota bacterium]
NPNNPITYSRFTKYSVDSVLFPYVYIRYVDSIELNGNKQEVVDTLILQFFTKDNLSLGYFNNQSRERENFARPTNLDHKSLTYPNNSYTIKIPLTDSNATENPTDGTWKQKVWRQAIPLNNKIPEDPNLKNLNIAGFQFAFKTMIPINHGDTMESLNGSIPKKRLNYFGYSLYLGQQGTQVKQIKHINNAFFSFGNQAYGAEENTWKSNTPGNAFFNDRYVQGLFYTKTQNLSIENLKKKHIGLGDAYPNPSKGSSFVNIDYKLPHSQNVEFKIFDLTGKTVQSTSTKSNHSGVNTIQINVEHLNDGLYLYQMKTDGFQEVQKLIINN